MKVIKKYIKCICLTAIYLSINNLSFADTTINFENNFFPLRLQNGEIIKVKRVSIVDFETGDKAITYTTTGGHDGFVSIYSVSPNSLKMLLSSATTGKFDKDEDSLRHRLEYLNEVKEIQWIEFDDNNVYLGFSSRPADFSWIVNGAAVAGNKAYGRGVHVWAAMSKYPHWRPGDGPYYCCATARYGKIEDSNCNK